jgi:hypothetical protein
MITGGDASARKAVVGAMNQWTSNVIGLQFTQVSEKKSADIVVTFQKSVISVASRDLGNNNAGLINPNRAPNPPPTISQTDVLGETIIHLSNMGLITGAEIMIDTSSGRI